MLEGKLSFYEHSINNAWTKMIQVIGIHAATVAAHRAKYLTYMKYEEAHLIKIEKTGVSFDLLAQMFGSSRTEQITEEFLLSLVSIITRLLGPEETRVIFNDTYNNDIHKKICITLQVSKMIMGTGE
ncbi:MAG: hypothetical protein AB1420_00320 [Bacillota bacterium]